LSHVPCGHESDDRSGCSKNARYNSPARRKDRHHRKPSGNQTKIPRPLASMLVVFKSFVQSSSCFGKTMLLLLSRLHSDHGANGAQNEHQSSRQSPAPKNDRKNGDPCTDKQQSDWKVNNSRMEWVGNRNHELLLQRAKNAEKRKDATVGEDPIFKIHDPVSGGRPKQMTNGTSENNAAIPRLGS
jgi:hypothetical protein